MERRREERTAKERRKRGFSSTDRGWKRRKSVARNDVLQRVYQAWSNVDGQRRESRGAISQASVAGVTIFTTLPLQPTKCNFLRYVCIRELEGGRGRSHGTETRRRRGEGREEAIVAEIAGRKVVRGRPSVERAREHIPLPRRAKESKVIITKVGSYRSIYRGYKI